MKIVIFSPHYGKGYGAGYSVYKECLEFAKEGHELFVICQKENLIDHKIRGVKYFTLDYNKDNLEGIYKYRNNLINIFDNISKVSPIDVVYTNSLEIGLLLKSDLEKKKIVYFSRSTLKGISRSLVGLKFKFRKKRTIFNFFLKYLEKRVINYSSKIIVKSKIMKDELKKLYNVADEKIKLVSGGFDPDDFKNNNKNKIYHIRNKILEGNKNLKVILYVGRISPVKGIDLIIDSMPKVLKKFKAKLLIVGGQYMDDYKLELDSKISDLGLENKVIFLGKIPQKEISNYISASDLVVAPSRYEPFGMIALQSIFLKKPTIISGVFGSKEILKNNKLLSVINLDKKLDISQNIILKLKSKTKIKNKFKFKPWSKVSNEIIDIFKEQ